ncbi:MAG: branched-chain amino acid ABC transporter substrate-binding protein [Candidatus Methylomirabilis sp.]|nr:branched-chain amino acid ABC transporter substrate-binding protein [Candidatus Methylomirabilis sp.]
MGRGWLRVVCNALALLLLVTTNAYAAGTLKVGVAGPLTGDQGALGQELKNGVTIAVEEWNAKGGLLGRRIEIVWGDDQHDPKQAVAVANKFVNEEVVGVVGHFNSSCSIPASNIYRDGGVVQLTPASTNPRFTERGLWNVFRVCGRDDQQGARRQTLSSRN